jgi:phospholipid-translocating ATPase
MSRFLLNGDGLDPRKDEDFSDKATEALLDKAIQQINVAESVKLRHIWLSGETQPAKFPSNSVKNTKYNIITFVPLVLYHQFKFFFNLFFLLITLSQFFPELQVGFLFTYIAPLAFVLIITMIKEAYDDITRLRRDQEVNAQTYSKFTKRGDMKISAKDIKVGNIIRVNANERIPADMILLYTSEESGTVFIRTDQMDGETDWKLRKAVTYTQQLVPQKLITLPAVCTVEEPHKNIYSFNGTFEVDMGDGFISEPLSLDHTLWASTVLTSGYAIGLVVYTGVETRSVMNSRRPAAKFGICDSELNHLAKLLFLLMIIVSFLMVLGAGFTSRFYIIFFRYLLLLSSIIPISLRVNLDMAKILYCYTISKDEDIPRTIPRNSNIPEELGRIQFLLSDKTGTLTRNEMLFKKLCLKFAEFDRDDKVSMDELARMISEKEGIAGTYRGSSQSKAKSDHLKNIITALALCHNVTPVKSQEGEKTYQASSPDEISLVKFAESVGIELLERKPDYIVLKKPQGETEHYSILQVFPFSSATKRMGIIVQHVKSGQIIFYLKGAEEVVKDKISEQAKFKILEDCENLARAGLRTLVFAQRHMSSQDFNAWKKKYDQAALLLNDREGKLREITELLEVNMEALGVTGVEDMLQRDVAQTIENMRKAGICVWILTGDKVETAECIAISTRLKTKDQKYYEMVNVTNSSEVRVKLEEFRKLPTRSYVLVIDGSTLQIALAEHRQLFINVAILAPALVCCRVAPTQKSQIVEALKEFTNKRVCSIGDGGNDVGMIQAAHIGIGIEGKEGRQASLAADFSISEFRSLNKLVLWHGRLSYKRTAKLSHFVFHRGLIISVIQALFSCIFYFCTIAIYNGVLMLGYATVYTMLPVFSIVLDRDADEKSTIRFPEFYQTLQNGRALGITIFCIWLWKSIYQGFIIICLTLILFGDDSFTNIVAITFTALIFIEVANVANDIEKWHLMMVISMMFTIAVYVLSMLFMRSFFDLSYIFSWEFIWKVVLVFIASWFPLFIANCMVNRCCPSESKKVMDSNLIEKR